MEPGVTYDVEKSTDSDGPWEYVFSGSIPTPQTFTLIVENIDRPYVRIVRPDS